MQLIALLTVSLLWPTCSQQAEYATLKEKLDSKASEEATRNRQKQAQENQVVLEKAKEYWPQHVSTTMHSHYLSPTTHLVPPTSILHVLICAHIA